MRLAVPSIPRSVWELLGVSSRVSRTTPRKTLVKSCSPYPADMIPCRSKKILAIWPTSALSQEGAMPDRGDDAFYRMQDCRCRAAADGTGGDEFVPRHGPGR